MNRGSYQRVYAENFRMLVGPAMIRSVQLTRTRIACEHSAMPPPLTYANYLDLEKLLTLEKPRSTPVERDETVRRSDADAATGALPTRQKSIPQLQ
jgi:hypothetical protein